MAESTPTKLSPNKIGELRKLRKSAYAQVVAISRLDGLGTVFADQGVEAGSVVKFPDPNQFLLEDPVDPIHHANPSNP